MKISQSALRDFYNPEYCKIKWEEVYLNGNRTQPTTAMLDGLVFEQEVIGMSRGGEVYEIPKGKTGKPLKRETDLLALAEKSKQIMDLKYTAIKEDESCRWNPYAWHDLEHKDFTQAIHYIEMYYQMEGIYLPFFYLVFGKSGWCKFISIDLTAESLENYRIKLKRFKSDFKDFKPKGSTEYSICRKCPILCDKRINKPNIITIEC